MLAEDLAEIIHHSRLTCSKQLLNDVIFIWITLATLKNSHKDRLTVHICNKEEMHWSWQLGCWNWTTKVYYSSIPESRLMKPVIVTCFCHIPY